MVWKRHHDYDKLPQMAYVKMTVQTDHTIEVLLVEDDLQYRSALREVIDGHDDLHCPIAVPSAERALEYMQGGLAPDIILLDIGLPGMSGLEGIPRFQKISPSLRIIILTVMDDDQTLFNAICLGASGYLLKSTTPANIYHSLHQVSEGGAVMTPKIAARVLSMFAKYSQPQKDYGLTQREKEILLQMIDGHSKKVIASNLFLSQHTVDTHIKNIYAKLHVHCQTEVVAKAIKERLI